MTHLNINFSIEGKKSGQLNSLILRGIATFLIVIYHSNSVCMLQKNKHAYFKIHLVQIRRKHQHFQSGIRFKIFHYPSQALELLYSHCNPKDSNYYKILANSFH